MPQELKPVLEMLKMLLRIKSAESDVAAKLIASSSDLQELAMRDDADIAALKGWRYDVFGKDALDLKLAALRSALIMGIFRPAALMIDCHRARARS